MNLKHFAQMIADASHKVDSNTVIEANAIAMHPVKPLRNRNKANNSKRTRTQVRQG